MGLDLGLERAGFITRAAVELDAAARKTIQYNHTHLNQPITVFEDVTQLTGAEILQATNLKCGEVGLISGGPPCQPFSTAGKRGTLGDPRGSLFRDFLRLVDEIQPRFFVMENVRGILSAAIRHRPIEAREDLPLEPEEVQGSAFRVILAEFERIGYHFVYGLLNAADYGVPQKRERLIILGSRDHEPLELPHPTHALHSKTLPKWRTLRDALEGLYDPEPQFQAYSESRLKFLRLVPEGGNWRSLPLELRQEAMGGAFHSGGGKVGFYRRLAWDLPAPTVTTSPAQKATDMCHPLELRPISVRESARIQGFPDDWVFCGSVSDQYRQIGNAVPLGLGYAIGRTLLQTLEGKTQPKAQGAQASLFEFA